MASKILIVEDERSLSRIVKYNLEKDGHRVVVAEDGLSALAAARKERPDLVILDIMLPKLDGIQVCKSLRQESQVPILFLTARKSELDRVLGFKMGADDYVTKPFSVAELAARVEALLRRSAGGAAPAPGQLRRVGALEVDFERHEVRVAGKPVRVTAREFSFLKLLLEADGRVLTRDRILELVWGYDQSMEIDTRTVDQHIARLRRKLGAEGARIATVINSGYKLQKE
ncbi:MAG: response regulator transcription factor [Elusimicrobia bacterium]|nr:response regulator transcription factor [Elusimicrobiota bacterium]